MSIADCAIEINRARLSRSCGLEHSKTRDRGASTVDHGSLAASSFANGRYKRFELRPVALLRPDPRMFAPNAPADDQPLEVFDDNTHAGRQRFDALARRSAAAYRPLTQGR